MLPICVSSKRFRDEARTKGAELHVFGENDFESICLNYLTIFILLRANPSKDGGAKLQGLQRICRQASQLPIWKQMNTSFISSDSVNYANFMR